MSFGVMSFGVMSIGVMSFSLLSVYPVVTLVIKLPTIFCITGILWTSGICQKDHGSNTSVCLIVAEPPGAGADFLLVGAGSQSRMF